MSFEISEKIDFRESKISNPKSQRCSTVDLLGQAKIIPTGGVATNKVKHERNAHFNQANLQNTINAVGGLFLTILYYYRQGFSDAEKTKMDFRETNRWLEP